MTDASEKRDERQTQQAFAVLRNYTNGFEIGSSLSDIKIILMLDGIPFSQLHMSFTSAKTLAQNLSKAVEIFEKTTEHSIMNMDQVLERYQKAGIMS